MSLKEELAKDLAFLRRESLDIYNRIHSIVEDVAFVSQMCNQYPDYPVVPNLRCGAWYVDPALSAGRFAYFKSTDGHNNNWSFNLRRPNLHLLNLLDENKGLILVDSTRAGKRMPDALSKTVPIWCAVINRAVRFVNTSCPSDWDTALYTPAGVVSPQEHHQIEKHLDDWARSLAASSYTLPSLPLPLRPIWITPSTSSLPAISDQTCIPIVCLSASKQVREGIERRSNGFTYVQGSGDDHELWGMGLNPQIYWANKQAILGESRASIEGFISKLVFSQSETSLPESDLPAPTPVRKVHGQISLTKIKDLPLSVTPDSDSGSPDLAYVLILPHDGMIDHSDQQESELAVDTNQTILRLRLPAQISSIPPFLFYDIFPRSMPFIRHQLSKGRRVCIACPTGKDLSVGVAIVALRLLFNEDGEMSLEHESPNKIDKASIRIRLQWVISSFPQANPYRSTLKRVNEFLMSHSYNPYQTAHPRMFA